MMPTETAQTLFKIVAVAILYLLLAQLTLGFFAAYSVVNVVWPPSGLALAVLLLGGKRYAWAVLAGAFVNNTLTGLPVAVALPIAVGSTLEALLAHYLLARGRPFNLNIISLRDYLRLIVLGAGIGCIIGAVFVAAVLLLSGTSPTGIFILDATRWWMGDTLGIVLLTPLMLIWQPPYHWPKHTSILELALPLLLTFLMGQIVFLGWFHDAIGILARGFLMFLFVTFTAIYLGIHGTVLVIVMIAGQALLGAIHGVGYFADDIAQTGLTNLWFYTVILALVGMAQATYLAERKQIEKNLSKEKQRYQLLLETATDGLHVLDAQGRLLEASDSFYQMLGYPVGTLLNIKDWDRQWSPEQLLSKIQQLIRQPAVFNTRHRRADNRVIDVEISARGIEIGGEPLLFASSRDITERKHFESALQESEARFRSVANAAPVLIWMSGTDKLCNWFNQVWLDFTGRRLEQELGNGWMEHVHPDDARLCQTVYATRFDARQPFQMEYRLRRYDGEYRWLLDCAVPRFDEQGVFLGYIGSCTDISKLKHAEATLHQFAVIAAHHLQEPTRRILNFTQQLSQQLYETGMNDDISQSLYYLEQSAIRQRALVSDIDLYLVASEPGGPIEAVDLTHIVHQVTARYGQYIEEHKASIDCAEGLPKIEIDKQRLHSLVGILTDNALLYARQDRAPIIRISGELKAGRVYCRFADNGTGIPPAYRERVFRVFERLQLSSNPRSTGIGLAIVKRIVESCNGSVSLQETPGGGLTVLFDLPQYTRDS
ncbi:MAG: PAS domain S-box protein [Methylovulum sp.]|nr:PAS domain S-box protein [Methylovulum sp.]